MSEDHDHTKELVTKYEQMLANSKSVYFDIDELEEIVEFYCEASKFHKALRVIEYAYTLFPNNTFMMLCEGQVLSALGHLNKALSKMKELEKHEPDNEEMLLTMSGIYSQLRDHQQSIELLKRVLAGGNSEFETEIYLDIALEYENIDRPDKAIEILHEALERNPENETFIHELAYCYDVSERTSESLEYYEKFIEKHPFSFSAWYFKANAQQQLDQLEAAIDSYDYCIAIQQDFTLAYYNKAHTLCKLGRYQQAIHTFEETYTYEPPKAPVYCHIGECFEKLNELDKAIFYYRKSISVDDQFADAFLGIGLVYDMQGKTEEGIQYIERAVELEGENPDYQLFLAELLKKAERWDEAQSITESLTLRFPDNEDVWLDHSDIFFEKGELKKALHVLNEGWKKCPQSSELGYRKVAYLMEAGDDKEAEELLFRVFLHNADGLGELEEYYPEISRLALYTELLKQRELLLNEQKKSFRN
ncbi:MAG: tetratricopeptide repeat protein [Flavobacteriales bacterium]